MRMPSSSLHQSCDSLAHSVFCRTRFFQPMRFFPSFLSPLLSQGFVVGGGGVPFFSTGVFQCDRCPFISFCVGPGRMGGLCCCASHGGINYFYLGAGANSGSPWILQAPNLHFNDVVILLTLYIKNFCFDSHQWSHKGHKASLLRTKSHPMRQEEGKSLTIIIIDFKVLHG